MVSENPQSRPGPGPQSPALARVARGDLCAGCGACAGLFAGKIALAEAPPGFPRPVQTAPLTGAEERLFSDICPGLGQRVEAAGRTDSALWGPYLEMRTGWATDPAIRHAGASGGALSALLVHLVASGAVDAVVQTAADPARAIANVPVISADVAAITAAAGSRYAPSAPLADLGRLRADGRRFAFVGKPCDAAALRALIAAEPDAARSFPVIVSFFCGGVPSHAGGRAVLAALGMDEARTVAFRYRGMGWPGRATARDAAGHEASMSYHDSWGGILSKHVQFRCKICADGTGAAADLVCADAWESDAAGYPVFDEAPGISLVVARTEAGARILAAAGLYAVGLVRIFGQEHSWVRMSRWMYENIPQRANVAVEYWDMTLPLPLTVEGQLRDRGGYHLTELSLYDADTPEKWEELAAILAAVDYYVVASQRVYGPVGLLRDLYPTTARFYTLLFQGRLGFRLARWEGTDMEVLGVRLVENPFARAGLPAPGAIAEAWSSDGAWLLPGADESWTVYDRPLVMVFRNEGRPSAEEIRAALRVAER